MIDRIANMFNVDLNTLYKSLGISGTSTGGVYIARAQSMNWEFQANIVDLVWAVVTCIVLTVISLLVTKLCRKIEKVLSKPKKEDHV